ncbi:retrotransposon protein, putative, ty1-copia subclass [Tanacetum coccineum]
MNETNHIVLVVDVYSDKNKHLLERDSLPWNGRIQFHRVNIKNDSRLEGLIKCFDLMVHPAQNINHSAFRSMFEREKLSGNNFNDWFRQLKLVLRVEKKMYVIEQPIPPAHAADSAANDFKSMFEKQAGVKRFDLIQTFQVCKLEDGKPVGAYVLKMKDYVEQLERLGYMLLQDLSVGLILNGLTSDFAGFVRNYNMHNMGKTIGELHALLIEYEKCLPKRLLHHKLWRFKVVESKRPIRNRKKLKAEVKGKAREKIKVISLSLKTLNLLLKSSRQRMTPTTTVKRGVRKLKQVEAIRSFDFVLPNGIVICLDNSHYAPTITRGVVSVSRLVDNGFIQCFTDYGVSVSKNNVLYLMLLRVMTIKALRSDRGGEYISQEFKDYLKACGIVQQLTPPYTPQHNGVSERRNRTLLDMVRSMMNLITLLLSFWDYALESAARILNMVPTKNVNKTPYESWYAEFFEKKLLYQEVSGRAGELKEIQNEDTPPSKITSEIPMEVKGFKPPHEEEAHVRRSARTHQPPERTVGVNGYFIKKTGTYGNVHTYKARLVAKGFTKLYEVDYEETFSPVAVIRAIRILIAIAAFYDYEIWQMDVKTAFLNGYLDEDIYMVQPEGFVNPKHPRKVCKLQRSVYGLKKASRS